MAGQRRSSTFLTIAAIVATLLSQSNAFADEAEVAFDIESQGLGSALSEFALQSGKEILFVETDVAGKSARGISGRYEPMAALELLLADSNLNYRISALDTVLVGEATGAEGGDSEAGNGTTAGTVQKPVMMAQASVGGKSTTEQRGTEAEETNEKLPIEEIVITGTQIRGAGAAGSKIITLDRAQIELGGFATTQELLQSIPQNFGGGANETTQAIAFQDYGNPAFSSSINLRGLGTHSTLSLVNGRRTAPGGDQGRFVDLNFIPIAAIERVEVLPDGASAIYGSDAIAGVVNVILRSDYEGAETTIRYAPETSDIEETRISQVFGSSWDSGNVLFTYEIYDRSELKSEHRSYTRNSDLTSFGGTDSSTTSSNPGNINRYTAADGSTVSVSIPIPFDQDGTALMPADLSVGEPNLQNIREGTTVLPSQKRQSAFVLLSQKVSDSTEVFADLRYSIRDFENRDLPDFQTRFTVPNTNPFFIDLDPLGGSTALRMDYTFVADYGAPRSSGEVEASGGILGATFDWGRTWEVEGYGSFSRADSVHHRDQFPNIALLSAALADPDPATAFNPFGDGSSTSSATLAAIEGFNELQLESELSMLNVLANGELFELPGGAVKLAIGAQFRDQSLRSDRINFTRTPEPVRSSSPNSAFDLERDVTAAFAELYFPLITEGKPGIKQLALSIAGRYEDYSDFGDTFNPKVGVSWSLTDALTVRSTVGTSFRAPLLTELDASRATSQIFSGVPDLGSPTGTSTVIFRRGPSPNLMPEEGATWTVGFDVEPTALPGFSVGLTYFSIEIDGVIGVPTRDLVQPLLEPDAFAPIIHRVPSDLDLEAVAAILADPRCFFCSGFFTADQIDAIVDLRLNNLNESEVTGLDLSVAYSAETDVGSFHLSFHGSRLMDFKERAFAGGPFEEQLNTFAKPTSLKLRGSLSWQNGGMSATVFGNQIGDYTSERGDACRDSAAGFCRVASWTTWDLTLGYNFRERFSGLLEGTKLALNVRNVFDTDPPFVDVAGLGVGFDPVNANPLGRFLALQLTQAW